MAQGPAGRLTALDGLRGIAVLAVVGYHTNLRPFRGGDLGVQVFFVLSGFLITSVLLRELDRTGRVGLGTFYLRRLLRLAPALLVVVGVVLLVSAFGLGRVARDYSPHDLRLQSLLAATYLSDVAAASGFDMGPLLHTWTLSIEEHFYLLWPPVLVFVARRRLGGVFPLAVSLVLAGVVLRAAMALSGAPLVRTTYGPDVRSDGLLLGCALAALLTQRAIPGWLHRVRPGWVGASVLLGAIIHPPSNRADALGAYTLTSLAALLLLVGLLPGGDESLRRVVSWSPLVHVGRISYGLYLWNFLTVRLIDEHTVPLPGPFSGAVRIALCFLAAELSYVLVEQPFLRLKEALGTRNKPLAKASRS